MLIKSGMQLTDNILPLFWPKDISKNTCFCAVLIIMLYSSHSANHINYLSKKSCVGDNCD